MLGLSFFSDPGHLVKVFAWGLYAINALIQPSWPQWPHIWNAYMLRLDIKPIFRNKRLNYWKIACLDLVFFSDPGHLVKVFAWGLYAINALIWPQWPHIQNAYMLRLDIKPIFRNKRLNYWKIACLDSQGSETKRSNFRRRSSAFPLQPSFLAIWLKFLHGDFMHLMHLYSHNGHIYGRLTCSGSV